MKMKDLFVDERPREKMVERGAAALSNAELLAILLRTGTGDMNVLELAQRMLSEADGDLEVLAAGSLEALCAYPGVGPGKAVMLMAAFELGNRRYSKLKADRPEKVASPKDVFRVMFPRMRNLSHEECWALFLNQANGLIGKEMISSGGMSSTVMDVRMVVRRAIEKKASGVILVHNHPSGNAMPSTEDITVTRNLQKGLKTCDIGLVDHVVISRYAYYSFSDEVLTDVGK